MKNIIKNLCYKCKKEESKVILRKNPNCLYSFLNLIYILYRKCFFIFMEHLVRKVMRVNIKMPKHMVDTTIAFAGNYSSILFSKFVSLYGD